MTKKMCVHKVYIYQKINITRAVQTGFLKDLKKGVSVCVLLDQAESSLFCFDLDVLCCCFIPSCAYISLVLCWPIMPFLKKKTQPFYFIYFLFFSFLSIFFLYNVRSCSFPVCCLSTPKTLPSMQWCCSQTDRELLTYCNRKRQIPVIT